MYKRQIFSRVDVKYGTLGLYQRVFVLAFPLDAAVHITCLLYTSRTPTMFHNQHESRGVHLSDYIESESDSGMKLGRPTALVREPNHPREADAYRDGDRRAQGDGKQLRGEHSTAPLRAVPRRDKHPVRKPLPKACLIMVIYCILTGLAVYYIALWLWYRYTDSRTSTSKADDVSLPQNKVSSYTLVGESRYKSGLIGTAQDLSLIHI